MEPLREKNYYERLNVTRDAGLEDVRRAYHSLAQSLHPDVYPEADQKKLTEYFQFITEAYNTLSNDEKREQYNRMLDMLEEIRAAPTLRMRRVNFSRSTETPSPRKRDTARFERPASYNERRKRRQPVTLIQPGSTGRRKTRGQDRNATVFLKLLSSKLFD